MATIEERIKSWDQRYAAAKKKKNDLRYDMYLNTGGELIPPEQIVERKAELNKELYYLELELEALIELEKR